MPTIDLTTPSAPADVPATGPLFREAFEKHLPAMMAIPADKLMNINLDIPSAVTAVLGAWGDLKAMRSQLAHELPSFDLASFDALEEYAMAMGHAHLEHLSSSPSSEALVALHGRAQELRDLFLTDTQALVRRGLVQAQQVAEYKGLSGYKNVAFELLGLVGVLRHHWPTIGTRTAIEVAELSEAERLGQQLVRASGAREQGPAAVAETALRRQRAFTLFMRSYDATRRAISFLRWEQGDADSIAPVLYTGRPRRRPDAPDAPPPASTPLSPVKPAAPVPPGLPGSNPFIS